MALTPETLIDNLVVGDFSPSLIELIDNKHAYRPEEAQQILDDIINAQSLNTKHLQHGLSSSGSSDRYHPPIDDQLV